MDDAQTRASARNHHFYAFSCFKNEFAVRMNEQRMIACENKKVTGKGLCVSRTLHKNFQIIVVRVPFYTGR